jgi:DNA polymerase/3'-5' exonuclease PolX
MLANEQIDRRLDEVAGLLNEQRAGLYRVATWRRAANTIRRLPRPVSQIYESAGIEGLRKLPGIADRIAPALRALILTGKLPLRTFRVA